MLNSITLLLRMNVTLVIINMVTEECINFIVT